MSSIIYKNYHLILFPDIMSFIKYALKTINFNNFFMYHKKYKGIEYIAYLFNILY